MNNTLKETITNRLQRLPDDAREAVMSVDYTNFLHTVGRDYELNTKQRRALFTEVLILLLGLEPIENYPRTLQEQLDVSKTSARNIAEDTKEMIISQVNTALNDSDTQTHETSDSATARTNTRGNTDTNTDGSPIHQKTDGAETDAETDAETNETEAQSFVESRMDSPAVTENGTEEEHPTRNPDEDGSGIPPMVADNSDGDTSEGPSGTDDSDLNEDISDDPYRESIE
jgi:hypothetical protein